MSSSSQALAALNALFEPSTAERPVAAFFAAAPAAPPTPDLPCQLDGLIDTDAGASWDGPSYRWYRGVDARNVLRIFRFQRGNSLALWHELLTAQELKSIQGPFRTQMHAQAAG